MTQIIKKALPVLLLVSMIACDTFDLYSPDYAKSSTYFANQTPVRTLVLGDNKPLDNTKDNNRQFSILVNIGGLPANNVDRRVEFMIDESLTQNLYTDAGDTLVPLPQSHYILSTPGSLIVPQGSMEGYIDAQVTDAFLNDPKAFQTHYVIPLKITSAETDSILQGRSTGSNPDPRIAEEWDVAPKNYTLYALKFMNPYHGNYFYFGKTSVKNLSDVQIDETVYTESNIKANSTKMLGTTGKNTVSLSVPVRLSLGDIDNIDLDLTFDDSGSISVKERQGSPVSVSGTGTFIEDGGEWGGLKRNLIALDYSYAYDYFVEPTTTIVNNKDASVSYTGKWTHNNEGGNYNGDRSWSNTVGSSFELDFFGFEIAVYTKTGNYGDYDVYIDDELVAIDVSTKAGSTNYQVRTFEQTGLENGLHTLRCVVKSGLVVFDFFESTEAGLLPNDTYNWNVRDTLVMQDRSVETGSFVSVVK